MEGLDVSTFRPMLAADISDQLDKLVFPVYATPKLDGVRAIIRADGVWSRSMKLIPNKFVQLLAGCPDLHGLDGELIAGSPTAPDVYRRTQRACATAESDDVPTFMAFDCYDFNADVRYRTRLEATRDKVFDSLCPTVSLVPADLVRDMAALLAMEEKYLNEGYEGLILRAAERPYKQGRSTVKEQGMLKLKRFVDSEAEIIGVEEEMHNGNAAKTSAIGTTERSSHKAGLVGTGRMGALQVRDLKSGVHFKVGTGFDAADRAAEWPLGKVIKYKSFLLGVKDRPRFPVYLGGREDWDR
jgi:DNA ligase-1